MMEKNLLHDLTLKLLYLTSLQQIKKEQLKPLNKQLISLKLKKINSTQLIKNLT